MHAETGNSGRWAEPVCRGLISFSRQAAEKTRASNSAQYKINITGNVLNLPSSQADHTDSSCSLLIMSGALLKKKNLPNHVS